jgi:hypothetical protein
MMRGVGKLLLMLTMMLVFLDQIVLVADTIVNVPEILIVPRLIAEPGQFVILQEFGLPLLQQCIQP